MSWPITHTEGAEPESLPVPVLRESRFGPYWDFGYIGATMILVVSHAPLKPPYMSWMLPHQLYAETVERIRARGYSGQILVSPVYDKGLWVAVPASSSREIS